MKQQAEYADDLDQSPFKDLNHLYERIYTEHHAADKLHTLSQLVN